MHDLIFDCVAMAFECIYFETLGKVESLNSWCVDVGGLTFLEEKELLLESGQVFAALHIRSS